MHKPYGALEVIKGVSFEDREREVTSLIGASGAGTSTTFCCINLLELPTRGVVQIDGVKLPLKEIKTGLRISDHRALSCIRVRLVMVFLQFNLWAYMTALESVTKGPVQILGPYKDEAVAKAEALLECVGIADKKMYIPADCLADSKSVSPLPEHWR